MELLVINPNTSQAMTENSAAAGTEPSPGRMARSLDEVVDAVLALAKDGEAGAEL